MLIVVCTALWGFAGAYVLSAVVPAFILGMTIAHARAPRDEGSHVRPGVLVLGGLFGTITACASVLLMWAATASEDVTIDVSHDVDGSPALIWSTLVDTSQRPQWNTWIVDLEPIGKGGPLEVGSRFRSMLQLEQHQVPGQHVITELAPQEHFAWTIEPPAGSALQRLEESIRIVAEDANGSTKLTYRLSYKVPSVVGRLFDRLVVRQSFRKVAEESLSRLASHALE